MLCHSELFLPATKNIIVFSTIHEQFSNTHAQFLHSCATIQNLWKVVSQLGGPTSTPEDRI